MSPEAVDLYERLAQISQPWQPQVVACMNDYEIKAVKLEGEFVWHTHADTDELFLVLSGRLRIDMRDGSVELTDGGLYVVPRGVEHRPVTDGLVQAVLIEPAGVVNTGDVGGPLATEPIDDVRA
ncbi:MAG: cupin domain-containing protein [Actinobacteria bacterium]|nr:cupin domain-containing protein [Actinomycetota bacterium]